MIAVVIICSWLSPLDAPAIAQVDAGLKRAFATFAIARTLNAVISVAQGTQVSVGVGVGGTFAPGQVLAPLNELVKHFSDVMLMVTIALGIQKVLITIGGYWLVKVVLTIAVLGWASFYFRHHQPPALLSKIASFC